MNPAHSWLIVIALFVIVAGLLFVMFRVDARVERRDSERAEAEDGDGDLAPVYDLITKRPIHNLKSFGSQHLEMTDEEELYDWKVQGL